MIYLLVLCGSIAGLCVLLSARVYFQQRKVRSFVQSVEKRTASAEERGMGGEEQVLDREKNTRSSAIELQKIRALVYKAEKAVARGIQNEAEHFYIQALTVNPNAHHVQAALAKLYLEMGRSAKAEALYKEALRNCEDPTYYANLGLVYYQQEKYDLACFAYREAYMRDVQNPDRAFTLGRACMAARQHEDAADFLEKASVRLSRNTELLRLLANCYEQLGQRDNASDVYKKINRLEPYDQEVKARLAALA